MFLQGNTPISNAATSVSVTFPTAFGSVPAVVLPVVRNVSADGTKYLIEASVTALSTTGFTAEFDVATNTANYELSWLAGDMAAVLDTFSALQGKRISDYPALALLDKNFKIPILSTAPTVTLRTLSDAALWDAVVRRAAEAPLNPAAGQRDGLEFFIDPTGGYAYASSSTGWGRWPVDFSTSWATQPFYVPFREAEVTITAVPGQSAYAVTFATAFAAGNIPKVLIQLSDVSGGDITLLSHQVTARSLSGFTIQLSAVPETNNLKVYYIARQLP